MSEQAKLVSILLRQGQMISTLASEICALQNNEKTLVRMVEQQGRFMADQSVRIDRLEQRLQMAASEASSSNEAPERKVGNATYGCAVDSHVWVNFGTQATPRPSDHCLCGQQTYEEAARKPVDALHL